MNRKKNIWNKVIRDDQMNDLVNEHLTYTAITKTTTNTDKKEAFDLEKQMSQIDRKVTTEELYVQNLIELNEFLYEQLEREKERVISLEMQNYT